MSLQELHWHFPKYSFLLLQITNRSFILEAGNLKQRILQLLGNTYNTKLVSVKEDTDYMNIYGFVGKPDTAKKTRGDQYFLSIIVLSKVLT